MPTVSIAMATYNGARFVRAQLDSFAAQVRRPDEVLVADDASTDATVQLVESFATSAPFPVRLIASPINTGINLNFDRALSACSSDVIFISDQDDVWLPNKIARVLEEFSEHRETLVTINNQIVTDADLNPIGNALDNLRKARVPLDSHGAGCATAFRRQWLPIALPIPDSYRTISYDMLISVAALELGVRRMIHEPLQYFRRHGSNTSDPITSNPYVMRGLANPQREWPELASWADIVADRIELRADTLRSVGVDPAPAIARLRRRSSTLRRRLTVIGTARARRLPKVAAMFLSGRYSEFSGWKSALKDLVR